jgi:hypothetical protein
MLWDQALEKGCENRSVEGMENERMEIGGVPWLRGDWTSLKVHAPIVLIMPAYSDS